MADSGNAKVSHAAEPSNQFSTGSGVGTLDAIFSDTVDLSNYMTIRGLYIGVAGNIKMTDWDGNVVGPIAVPQGSLPLRPRRIYATGTTASQILGLR